MGTEVNAKTKYAYPSVGRSDFVEELHGESVADPYRWLEDPSSEETREFVEKQNALTDAVFKEVPHVQETKARMTELFDFEKYWSPVKHGGKYIFSKNDGLQNQNVLYMQDTLISEPTVLLDPNTLSVDGTAALGACAFSEAKLGDGKLYFAYGVKRGGSDWETVKVMAVHEGCKVLSDTIEWVKFSSIVWTHDDKGFFYSRYPPPAKLADDKTAEGDNSQRGTETDANMNHQIWYHAIHTPQAEDRLVFAYPAEPSYTLGAEVSDDGQTILFYLFDGCKNANMVHIVDLATFEAFMKADKEEGKIIEVKKLVDNLDASFNYILNDGSVFYFTTNLDAPRERVVRADLSSAQWPPEWEEVIPEQPDQIVQEGVYPVKGDKLVVTLLKDVHNVLYVYDLNGVFLYEIELPTVGTVSVTSQRKETEWFFRFTSFLYPGSIFRVDMAGDAAPTPELFRETHVKGFDASLYEATQVFYPSKDGTKIPMFLVKAKQPRGPGPLPTYLYGYGGFNISLSPSFSITRLVFIQHFGGMLALPNLRGGGEYGEKWHEDGMLFKKQNVFDDFEAAAEYLIKEGYTTASKIAIHGGSNGGLLVGACANQRPDLFRCGVAAVGVMDMLRFHKFTIGHAWRTDYGDPDVAKDFQYIRTYSPLHNVPDTSKLEALAAHGGYPAMLLTTGDHDDRVVPLHSFKLISELQHKLGHSPYQKNPLLIRIETKAGHGGGKPTAKIIEENAEVFAFIAWSLGTSFQP